MMKLRAKKLYSLLDGQGMWAGDGVAIEECEELAESIKERPVGQQTDTLVGVNRARGCGAVGAAAGGCHRSVGGGGFVWIWV